MISFLSPPPPSSSPQYIPAPAAGGRCTGYVYPPGVGGCPPALCIASYCACCSANLLAFLVCAPLICPPNALPDANSLLQCGHTYCPLAAGTCLILGVLGFFFLNDSTQNEHSQYTVGHIHHGGGGGDEEVAERVEVGGGFGCGLRWEGALWWTLGALSL